MCSTDGSGDVDGGDVARGDDFNDNLCLLCQTQGPNVHYCLGYNYQPDFFTLPPDQYTGYNGFVAQFTGTSIGCPSHQNRTTMVFVLCDQPSNSLSLLYENPLCNYAYELKLQFCQVEIGTSPTFQVRAITPNTMELEIHPPFGIQGLTYQVYLNDQMVYTGLNSDVVLQNLGAGSSYGVSVAAVFTNYQSPPSPSQIVQTLNGQVASREKVLADAAASTGNGMLGVGIGIGIGIGISIGTVITIMTVLLSVKFISPTLLRKLGSLLR